MEKQNKQPDLDITYGMYGTFEHAFPKERFWDRVVRKLAYVFTSIAKVSPKRPPLFIVGTARSGTTVLMRVLRAHPNIATLPGEGLDLWYPSTFPWRRSDLTLPPYWKDAEGFSKGTLERWTARDSKKIRSVFEWYRRLKFKKHFLNKNAMSAFYMEHMLDLFPNAKFIHIYRDGRPVALSYAKMEYARMQAFPESYKKAKLQLEFNEVLRFTSKCWNDQTMYFEETLRGDQFNSNNLYSLSYEDLCNDPNAKFKEISEFLGLKKVVSLPSKIQLKATNDKFDALDDSMKSEITDLMRAGLELKGYI